MSSNRSKGLESLIRELRADFVNGWIPIAQTTLTGSVASVTFSSIPGDFRHLAVFCEARTDDASEFDSVLLRMNSDSGAKYDNQWVYGRSSSALASPQRATTYMEAFICEAANSRASNFSPGVGFLFSYRATDREKWMIALSGAMGDVSADTDLFVHLRAERWRDTNGITTITILPGVGSNFVSGSIFQLYGIL
jgi:hypothetical protein